MAPLLLCPVVRKSIHLKGYRIAGKFGDHLILRTGSQQVLKKYKFGDPQHHRCTFNNLYWQVFNLVIFTEFINRQIKHLAKVSHYTEIRRSQIQQNLPCKVQSEDEKWATIDHTNNFCRYKSQGHLTGISRKCGTCP